MFDKLERVAAYASADLKSWSFAMAITLNKNSLKKNRDSKSDFDYWNSRIRLSAREFDFRLLRFALFRDTRAWCFKNEYFNSSHKLILRQSVALSFRRVNQARSQSESNNLITNLFFTLHIACSNFKGLQQTSSPNKHSHHAI